MKRLAPVLALFVLSPLIAEYVSGSMSMTQLWIVVFMMPFYGAGAVLIRETVRRAGRGWGAMAFLALAYGLLEEGITTQSLFNPHFRGLALLDYGFVPALSTGLPWTVYVVGIHVVWSMLVPIALVECLFADRGKKPWLGRIGLGVVGLLFAADAVWQTFQTMAAEHFLASPMQLGAVATLIALTAAAAFAPMFAPKPASGSARTGGLPPPALAAGSFLAGSAFILFYGQGQFRFAWPYAVAGMLISAAALIWLSRHTDGRRGLFALMAGALGVYLWSGFMTEISLYGPATVPAHAILAAGVAALLGLAYRRGRKTADWR